jgi:hypothetical protein
MLLPGKNPWNGEFNLVYNGVHDWVFVTCPDGFAIVINLALHRLWWIDECPYLLLINLSKIFLVF